jgi:hypothetical protein
LDFLFFFVVAYLIFLSHLEMILNVRWHCVTTISYTEVVWRLFLYITSHDSKCRFRVDNFPSLT